MAVLAAIRTANEQFEAAGCDGLGGHVQFRVAALPEDPSRWNRLVVTGFAAHRAEVESDPQWADRCDDWDQLHQDARVLLDDPMYWDAVDEFAPHGNDSGADTFAAYVEWRAADPEGDGLEFATTLNRGWDIAKYSVYEEIRLAYDESIIGAAFAELKVLGTCGARLADAARRSILRQREEALKAEDWPHRVRRLETLAMMEQKLAGY